MAGDGSVGRLPSSLHSMNAYLGYKHTLSHLLCRLPLECLSLFIGSPGPSPVRALPIRRCLDLGADIVVTGRCVDSAIALGPLMHSVRLTGLRTKVEATAV